MANIDGDWKVTVNSPMGAQEITLSLATAGDTVTGTLSGAMGSTEVKNGKVDGDNVSFDATITEPFSINISVTATVDGDAISGQVKTQGFGSFPMKGARV
jgi:hypothetical protein